VRRVVLVLALLSGCEGSPLDRSCGGNSVGLCAPYEHAEVGSASLTPAELTIADFTMEAHIVVEVARCAGAPAPHAIDLIAIVPGDAGSQVMSLLTLEDGEDGDAISGDGDIDVTVTNPFIATVPPNTDLLLRFTPRSTAPGGCTGVAAEIPYRTGPPRPEP
jgi:hypothetical protein